VSSISRFAAVAPPTADVEVSDAEADERLNALTFPNLPEEFWEARPVLCHIRLRPYSATSAEIGIGSDVTGIAASSTGSPLGQALVGRPVGDTIAYRGPEGELRAEVVALHAP
jgi:Transcription elongation factor, GreA/GreB, C-term